jgi:hypothetical protein
MTRFTVGPGDEIAFVGEEISLTVTVNHDGDRPVTIAGLDAWAFP